MKMMLATAAAVGFLCAAPVSAATITYTFDTYAYTPAFDPALGTLDSVDVQVQASANGAVYGIYYGLEQTEGRVFNVRAEFTSILNIFGPNGIIQSPTVFETQELSYHYPPGSYTSVALPFRFYEESSFSITKREELDWITDGTYEIMWAGLPDIGIYYLGSTDNMDVSDAILSRKSLVTATFNYTPFAGDVPEPATWAMMIAGFGLAGAALRRRERKLACLVN